MERKMKKLTKTQIAMRIFTVAFGIVIGVIVVAAIGIMLQQWGMALVTFAQADGRERGVRDRL
jgi:hypothetical protein